MPRSFKTSWFAKAARRAKIKDVELCRVAHEAQQGKAVDLGGGVYKKRLNLNLHRSILLAKRGDAWIFVFLYAKQDKADIEADELAGFRKLAKSYDAMTATQLSGLIAEQELMEICNDTKKQIQG